MRRSAGDVVDDTSGDIHKEKPSLAQCAGVAARFGHHRLTGLRLDEMFGGRREALVVRLLCGGDHGEGKTFLPADPLAAERETAHRRKRPLADRLDEMGEAVDQRTRSLRAEARGVEIADIVPVTGIAARASGHPLPESLDDQRLRQSLEKRRAEADRLRHAHGVIPRRLPSGG